MIHYLMTLREYKKNCNDENVSSGARCFRGKANF